MMSKLKIVIPLLLVLGAAYKFVLAKPEPVAAKPKVHGEVYVLPTSFLINLEGGRFAKFSVAMVFKHGYSAAAAAGGHGAAAKTPEGYGELTQEPLVRSIITDTITDRPASELTSNKGRHEVQELILKRIAKKTDVKAEEVLFTDLAIQ